MSLRELSNRLKNWRVYRPDERTMDEFIRLAQALEYKSERDNEELEALRARVADAERENIEQARLLGEGGSREAALMAKVAELESKLAAQDVPEGYRLQPLSEYEAMCAVLGAPEDVARDAARYRALRSRRHCKIEVTYGSMGQYLYEMALDVAIDEHIAAQQPLGKGDQ